MTELLNTRKALLSQLSALNVASNARPTVAVQARDPVINAVFDQEKEVIASLVKAGEVLVLKPDEAAPQGCLKGFVSENISAYVKVLGLIDIKLEMARITKRLKQLEDLASKLQQKMSIPDYEDKVPLKIRNDNDAKLAGYRSEIEDNLKQMKMLETIGN